MFVAMAKVKRRPGEMRRLIAELLRATLLSKTMAGLPAGKRLMTWRLTLHIPNQNRRLTY